MDYNHKVLRYVTHILIYSIIRKLTTDDNGEKRNIPKIIHPVSFYVDDTARKQGRYGLYGFCELDIGEDYGREIGTSVDWPMKSCKFSNEELIKLAGVIEYKTREVISNRIEFDMSDEALDNAKKDIDLWES